MSAHPADARERPPTRTTLFRGGPYVGRLIDGCEGGAHPWCMRVDRPLKAPLDATREPARPDARIDEIVARLARIRAGNEWPTGPRDLWTDAFGLLLLVSLHRLSGDARHLVEARSLVAAVESTLEPRAERRLDLAAWILALGRSGRLESEHRRRGVELVRQVHQRFVLPGSSEGTKGIRDPGGSSLQSSLEPLEPFYGYVAYRSLDEPRLAAEIADLREQIERSYRDLVVTRDLALGMMLWMTHFHPDEPWAQLQRDRCLRVLEHLWVDPPGYFCREPGLTRAESAGANHAISIGLQAVRAMPERVEKLGRFLRTRRRPDDEDRRAVTQILACCAEIPGELLFARASA